MLTLKFLNSDLLLFAASIGCQADELNLLYELHPKFAGFPTYPIQLTFKGTETDVIDFYKKSARNLPPGLPPIDTKRALDGERYIEQIKPLPATSAGRNFEMRSKCLGVYDKGKSGIVVDTEMLLVDADTDEVYTRCVSSGFFVGQGGHGGPKGPKKPTYTIPNRKPDATHLDQTDDMTALRYRLSGDYNPLHADPTIGPKMGLKGAILHGLCTFNHAAHAVLRAFGGSDPKNFKSFQARFASPVMPGDALLTSMWKVGQVDGYDEIYFVTTVNGKPVLSNGRALIKAPSKSNL